MKNKTMREKRSSLKNKWATKNRGPFLRHSELPLVFLDYSIKLTAFPHAFISFEIQTFYSPRLLKENWIKSKAELRYLMSLDMLQTHTEILGITDDQESEK